MKNTELDNNPISLKAILRIAVPVTLQLLVTSSLSFVDIFMVSSLGETSVAAVGLINKVYFVFILTLTGFASAVSILVAQYWGAKRNSQVYSLISAALVSAFIITVPLLLTGLFASGYIAPLLSPNAAITENTIVYWQWTSPFILLTGLSIVLATIQRATGSAVWPMAASIVALLCNTLMNYLVLFGPFESLHTGLPGVAMATNLSRLFELSLLIVTLSYHLKPIWSWSNTLFKECWRHGWVLSLQEATWSSGMFAFFIIYSYMGASELAAMSLMSPIESIMIELFVGVGIATSILLGQQLGQNNYEQAWRLSQYVTTRFPIAALIAGAILALCASHFVGLFSSVSDDVKLLMTHVWLIYCLALPFKTHNMISVIGVLRSGGDNPFVFATELISVWCLAVPVTAFAGLILGWSLEWVLLLTAAEEALKLFVFRWRRNKKVWLKNLTVEHTA